ncbi:MFS general substrate transporter [Trametes versicolor FP-101664 SS1]|uniref:MFS general substrate transporter n=1 Tax=Trametes versicolor (strain FP-101664) TaxID=717944 RepID=UPI0004623C8E|nr:MFS general substrate transporter [Trametes versicolor FP-101664 SS1]EIW53983.1 MFS general substrate transporter [Trametes versicolor FP-101664 SS1]
MATLEDGAGRDDQTVVEARSETVSLTDQTNLLPRRKVIAVFFGLSLCILVSCLDATIVATALPTISAAFNAGSVVSWVPSAYFLTSTAFQPLYGRFSDIFGRKAALCMAMGIFMLGSLAAGFSRSITQLIVLRGLAGAGGGGIVSMAQIVISDVVSLRDRGKYQGIIGVVVAFGFAVGPLLGGVLAEKAGWRWCFWVTLPVSACAVAVVILVVPLKPVEGNIGKKLAVVDYVGTALTLVSCTLVILPLIWGGVTFPWSSPIVLAPLFAGAVTVAFFCLWEWKGARLPIVPMYIFKQVTVTGVYITMLINGFVFYSSLFYLPQYFQVGLGYSAIRSGIFLLPVLVSQTLASFISGQIITWTGRYRATIYVGFGIWTIACGCLSTVTPDTAKGLLVFFMLLAGTGAGGTLQTTTVAAQASVSRRDMSVVTAVRNFIRLLGGTLSLAIGATIINNSLRHSMTSLGLPSYTISTILDDPTILGARTSASDASFASLGVSPAVAERILGAYVRGFRTVFILNASLNAVATLAAILLIRHTELTRGDEDDLRKKAIDEALQASEKNSIMEAKAESPSLPSAPTQNV